MLKLNPLYTVYRRSQQFCKKSLHPFANIKSANLVLSIDSPNLFPAKFSSYTVLFCNDCVITKITKIFYEDLELYVVCVCVHACVRACVCVCKIFHHTSLGTVDTGVHRLLFDLGFFSGDLTR